MTLEELKIRSEKSGFKYAYGQFKESVEPPHLVTFETGTTNFMADDKVYKKITGLKLDYTYINKDLEMENKIENEILFDIPWNKSEETYLEDEEIWQVSYFFEI